MITRRRPLFGFLWGIGQLLLWGIFVFVGIHLLQALASWNRSRAAAATPNGAVGNSLADAARSAAVGIGHFFDPVTRTYGPEATTILFVVLILALGFLVFRQR
jgi:hypothetical protein